LAKLNSVTGERAPAEIIDHPDLAKQICQNSWVEKIKLKNPFLSPCEDFQLFKNAPISVNTVKGSVYHFSWARFAASVRQSRKQKQKKYIKLQKEKKSYVKKSKRKNDK